MLMVGLSPWLLVADMSVIEKNQELLTHAASQLRVMDVFLREMKVEMSEELNPVLPNQEFCFQFRFQPLSQSIQSLHREDDETADDIKIIEYRVVAGARFLDPKFADLDANGEDIDPSLILAEISATFAATYAKNACSDDALKVFGQYNVPYHVWPYWRELLQSTLPRMKLPSVTLGMYVPSKGVHSPATLGNPETLKPQPDEGLG